MLWRKREALIGTLSMTPGSDRVPRAAIVVIALAIPLHYLSPRHVTKVRSGAVGWSGLCDHA